MVRRIPRENNKRFVVLIVFLTCTHQCADHPHFLIAPSLIAISIKYQCKLPVPALERISKCYCLDRPSLCVVFSCCYLYVFLLFLTYRQFLVTPVNRYVLFKWERLMTMLFFGEQYDYYSSRWTLLFFVEKYVCYSSSGVNLS